MDTKPVEPHGADWQEGQRCMVAVCPICCDSHLDEEELVNPFCACGYQMCSFCLNRIQTEADNTCPHCRTAYQDEPQSQLRERLIKLAEQRANQPQAAPYRPPPPPGRKPAPLPPPALSPRGAQRPRQQQHFGVNGHAVLEVPRQRTIASGVGSPGRNLEIAKEDLWPGLSPPPQAPSSRTAPQLRQPPPPPSAAAAAPSQLHIPTTLTPPTQSRPSHAALLAPLQQQQQQQPPSTPPSSRPAAGSSAPSSAPTAAGTPPSPVSTVVVSYNGTFPPGHPQASTAARGQCAVSLRRVGDGGGSIASEATTSGNEDVAIDLEGAALVSKLQQAVRSGSVSAQAAAAAVLRHLQAKHAGDGGGGGGAAAVGAAMHPFNPQLQFQQQPHHQLAGAESLNWITHSSNSSSFASGNAIDTGGGHTSLFSGWGNDATAAPSAALGNGGGGGGLGAFSAAAPSVSPLMQNGGGVSLGGSLFGDMTTRQGLKPAPPPPPAAAAAADSTIAAGGLPSRAPPPGFAGTLGKKEFEEGSTLLPQSRFG